MNGLEAEFGSRMTFVRLDATEPENEAFQLSIGLRGHPTAALIAADGTVSARWVGGQTAETLRQAIEEMLAADP